MTELDCPQPIEPQEATHPDRIDCHHDSEAGCPDPVGRDPEPGRMPTGDRLIEPWRWRVR
jgi:hypothetical protein